MPRTGRPKILTDELMDKADEYLKDCSSVDVYTLLPSIEGLAIHLDVARSTMYKWRDENEDFSDILERLLEFQAQKLMQNGLVNKYNSTISKLILSKHGYVDKSEVDTSGEVKHTYEELDDDKLEAAIKARENRVPGTS